MNYYILERSDGYYSELLAHEEKYSQEEIGEILEDCPPIPDNFVAEGGDEQLSWDVEWLTKHKGFVHLEVTYHDPMLF